MFSKELSIALMGLSLLTYLNTGMAKPFWNEPPKLPTISLPNPISISTTTTEPKKLISINQASLEELSAIKCLGTKKAQAIINYRTTHGPFKSLEELKEVKGIGDKIFEKLVSSLTLS